MALTAIPVGFVAGLFGIGGGLITVPFLFYIFNSLGIDQQYVMHLAVGTSFAIIIPTSIVSVLTHHKFNAVDFNVVKNYGIFVIVGVIIGTIFAATFKTKSLVLFFSIVILFLGIYLLLIKEKDQNIISEMKLYLKIILGSIVGFILETFIDLNVILGSLVLGILVGGTFTINKKFNLGIKKTSGFILELAIVFMAFSIDYKSLMALGWEIIIILLATVSFVIFMSMSCHNLEISHLLGLHP